MPCRYKTRRRLQQARSTMQNGTAGAFVRNGCYKRKNMCTVISSCYYRSRIIVGHTWPSQPPSAASVFRTNFIHLVAGNQKAPRIPPVNPDIFLLHPTYHAVLPQNLTLLNAATPHHHAAHLRTARTCAPFNA